MAEGVDYSFPPLPSPSGLVANGKHFVGRYVGPGSGKFITTPERDALFAAGLDVFLNVEGSAGDAAGGYGVGVSHAQSALAHARRLGAPEHTAFYFAIDYDVASKGWDAPRAYLQGAASVVGLQRVGVYGEHDVMGWAQRDGVASWFFQTYAWSNGAWFAGNHVEQYLNNVGIAGGRVDLCRSLVANFGQWRSDGADPGQIFPGDGGSVPVGQQGDQDMILIVQKGTGAIYTFNGVWRSYQGLPSVVASLVSAGVRQVEVDDVTEFGIEWNNGEFYADRDRSRSADAKVLATTGSSGGGASLSEQQVEDAAFRGAQRAEDV